MAITNRKEDLLWSTRSQAASRRNYFIFFEDISAIPRGSGNEKGLSDYLVKFAKDRNLWVYQDESNNVIIKKEGSEGAKRQSSCYASGTYRYGMR